MSLEAHIVINANACPPPHLSSLRRGRRFEAQNFLLEPECNHIKAKANPHMKPSPVSLMDHDRGKADSNWRTR